MAELKFGAIGVVEVSFYTNALIILDEMMKTSDIRFVNWEKTLGGQMVTIIVAGDTSAVQAAVDAAIAVGDTIGAEKIKVAITISNPDAQIIKLVNKENMKPKAELKAKAEVKVKTEAKARVKVEKNLEVKEEVGIKEETIAVTKIKSVAKSKSKSKVEVELKTKPKQQTK